MNTIRRRFALSVATAATFLAGCAADPKFHNVFNSVDMECSGKLEATARSILSSAVEAGLNPPGGIRFHFSTNPGHKVLATATPGRTSINLDGPALCESRELAEFVIAHEIGHLVDPKRNCHQCDEVAMEHYADNVAYRILKHRSPSMDDLSKTLRIACSKAACDMDFDGAIAKSQATDAALSRQVACTDWLGGT